MRAPAFDDARHSAVLAVLADGPDGVEVLTTRRSQHMSSHRGEISLPGGRLDAGETYEQAALREAHEEVGLPGHLVRVVGRLDPLSTLVSRSYIMPVVAHAPDPEVLRDVIAPQTIEVDRVLWVPLRELTRADTYREELWFDPPLQRPVYFFELDDETVWGATARMLHQLLRIALGLDASSDE